MQIIQYSKTIKELFKSLHVIFIYYISKTEKEDLKALILVPELILLQSIVSNKVFI